MCELLAMSASRPARLTVSLRTLASHGAPDAASPDGWGVAFDQGDHVVLHREAAPAGAGIDAAMDTQRLWRWRGLARKKAQGPAAGPENRGHFAALKEWKVAIG